MPAPATAPALTPPTTSPSPATSSTTSTSASASVQTSESTTSASLTSARLAGTTADGQLPQPPTPQAVDTISPTAATAAASSSAAAITSRIPSMMDPYHYQLPMGRLKPRMDNGRRTPLLLVACGSFSPITYLHLRMFEMAADYVRFSTDFELVGGYLSPVSDAYRKGGLASAEHRVAMCELAVEQTSTWLMVDPWEPMQKEYIPTAQVLDHFDREINGVRGGIATGEVDDDSGGDGGGGERRRPVRIALLAGADLIHTMSTPGVWSEEDLDHILGRYGTFIVERSGTDIDEAIASLQPWKDNIYVIQQMIQNDVSSTKIRLFLRREMSVRYLIPGAVIDYIEHHRLYQDDPTTPGHAEAQAQAQAQQQRQSEQETPQTTALASSSSSARSPQVQASGSGQQQPEPSAGGKAGRDKG